MEHVSLPYRMRRVAVGFAITIVALVIMVPLAACGGGSSTGTSGTSGGPVHWTIWSWVSGLDKSARLFTQTHSGRRVKALMATGVGVVT
jgi:ABC-type glycerol-3-phosphate transport system substrate-binding protein